MMSLSKASEVLRPAWDYLRQSVNIWKVLAIGAATVVVVRVVRRPRNLPPGPKGWPLVGAVTQLGADIHEDAVQMSRRFKSDVVCLYVFGKLLVLLNSHGAIKEAFVNQGTTFSDRPQSKLMYLLGLKEGIFGAPFSEEFADHKKFATRALKILGLDTSNGENRIQTEIDAVLVHLSDHTGEAIDLRLPIRKAMMNIICGIVSGKHHDWDDPELTQLIAGVENSSKSITSKTLLLEFLPLWFSRTFLHRIVKKVATDLNVLSSYIRKEIKYCKQNSENNSSLIDLYLTERDDIDEDTLAGTILVLFPDAVLTMEITFSWIMLYLVRHPHTMTRLQAEIDKVCGSSNKPSLSDRSNMPYTQAVIKEAFRKASIAPISAFHKPLRDATLFGYRIPKDSFILANIYAVHSDPELFPEPELFNPERFIDPQGELIDSDAVMPFGAGHRMCVSDQLVKAELFLFLASLVQRFRFHLADNQSSISLDPKGTVLREPPPYELIAIPR